MKKKYLLLLFIGLLAGTPTTAQSLAEAKALYEKGDYEQAKPAFQKLVKTQPANGSYNLWYGVCCLETNEAEEGLKYLETAVKKRVSSGRLYLGRAYDALYRFEDAVSTFEDYIADLEKRKRPTDEAELLLEKSKAHLRMLKGVERVCVVDSIVVGKENFLDAYRTSPETGSFDTYQSYFGDPEETGGTVYETELGNKLYYSELSADSILNIFSATRHLDAWSEGTPLPDNINGNVNASYPYVMADGITLYYASDGPDSMGGYDIFVTRYNPYSDSFLTPENAGMPFNSPFNDYMLVIDEFNQLGWFASDRYQPEGKVCIYIFIPNETKLVYDYESTESEKLISLAQLHSIQDTWANEAAVNEALARLQSVINTRPQVEKQYDFCFIIDDNATYHELSDFRSADAKEQYKRYRQLAENYRQKCDELETMRTTYATSSPQRKEQLSSGILKLEEEVRKQGAKVDEAAIAVRLLEKQY